VFSLVYAAWRTLRPAPDPALSPTPGAKPATPAATTGPPLRVLLVAGAVVVVGSFAVWLVWHHGTETPLNANWPHWPQSATMFTLGVLAGERGWLEALPWPRARRLGLVAGVGVLAIAGLAGATIAAGVGTHLAITTEAWTPEEVEPLAKFTGIEAEKDEE